MIDFGEHNGKELHEAPLTYVVFLAGYRFVKEIRYPDTSDESKWIDTHKPLLREQARHYLSSKCWFCGSAIQPIGHARANGKDHPDWSDRCLHKKCFLHAQNSAKPLVAPVLPVPPAAPFAPVLDGIPRDTLGHPMPPPMPAGFVSLMPASEWVEYWRLSPNGGAPVPSVSYVTKTRFEDGCWDRKAQWDFTPPDVPHLQSRVCRI